MSDFILDKYRPLQEWFAHKPHGVHGIAHAARVLVWANAIANKLLNVGEMLDLEAVRWTSVLHDVGRITDSIDPGHGQRAADWIARNRKDILPGLGNGTLDKIVYCCKWHDTTDIEIPELTVELKCIKDADGLDRVRISDLNSSFLRTQYARDLVDAAYALFRNRLHVEEPWKEVRVAAINMNLWQ